MPLQLGGTDTARPQTVTWNPDIYQEVKEAIARIKELEKQGFIAEGPSDGWQIGEVRLRPPDRDPNIGCFRILSDNGDDRVIWDRRI